MEPNEGKAASHAPKEQKPAMGGLRARFKDSWLGKNWGTVLVLVAIIFVAFFVRTYFGYSTAVSNGFLVAGGSDSYYHERVIEYVESTGSHLVNDPLLNYPLGVRNERPPLYDWSVAVTSMFISGASGIALTTATGYTLLFSTVFWGALTVIPLYLLTRAAFGNRAGLLASLLFALMPGHIQRSMFADADHDAMILFFVVFGLYFLLRALMTINGTKWVSSWKAPKSITSGIKTYVAQNKRSMIYSMLGGVCIAAVAMTWTGYTYILVIILVYFLVQVIINRFRNVDSMGVFFAVGTMLATAFVIMAPLYWQLNYWTQWFDIPVYLFLASMLVGGIFMVSRDYPWTLVIPVVVAIIAVGLVAVYFIAPTVFEAIISGQGYLVKSKLYSTISEAQAPSFSDLVLSFGAVTFWFAVIGVVWAAIKVPKNPSPYFVFVVVWMGVSMYMAASAARFMFNASPAFAMAAGWILALFIALFKFEEVPKAFAGFRSNPWSTLKKATKLRHVVAVLFLAFLVILPNAWGAVDAGIPSEDKKAYDLQVYNALPDILHPSSYDSVNGSYWYFGAFSYSLTLPDTYWPVAWEWFSTESVDANWNESEKIAFMSWWDYGFEAVQEGKHPTVADNFQNGYRLAGSFLTAQSENDAIALFIVRILEKTGFDSTTVGILEANGLTNTSTLQDIYRNPSNYIDVVLSDPDTYGPYSSDLSSDNAKIAAARIELQTVGEENLVNMYRDLRESSGYSIGYVAIDSRLFPFSATSSNIFYAPAKLSDRVIDEYTNAPTDYYTIKALLYSSSGYYSYVDVRNVTSTDTVIGYQIFYTDLFYQTMIYRAFMGISPADIGESDDYAIPGIAGDLADYDAMPAYNLSHFRQVFRTAYFNPYTDSANHSNDWEAVSYEEAQFLQAEISAGRMNGTVDLSSYSLQSGVVFVQYYDGAVLEGRATSNDGSPYAGIYVTVVDELGIPHQVVKTDSEGYYKVLLPFSVDGKNISVVYSAGTLDGETLIASELDRVNYVVSYAQAMRDEAFDYSGDITLPAASVSGRAYLDLDSSGTYSTGDQVMAGATIVMENTTTGFRAQTIADSNGNYSLIGLAGMTDTIYAIYEQHQIGTTSVALNSYTAINKNIAVKTASISGTVSFTNGGTASGVSISLKDKVTGKVTNTTSSSTGTFQFSKLLPGEYTLYTTDLNQSVGSIDYNLTAGAVVRPALSLYSATQVSGTLTIGSTPQANVVITLTSPLYLLYATTDSNGHYSITLPQGSYTVYAMTVQGGSKYVVMDALNADQDYVDLDLAMTQGSEVTGTVKSSSGSGVSGATVVYSAADGTYQLATTNSTGGYSLVLPANDYFVYAKSSTQSYWGTTSVTGNSTKDLTLVSSWTISGKTYYDADGDNTADSGEYLANVTLRVQLNNSAGQVIYFLSGTTGSYSILLPAGGDYVLNASKDGYYSWQSSSVLNGNTTQNINLDTIARTVTGTVTHNGTPVQVTINFNHTSGGQDASVTTAADGTFSLSLKPGTYQVVINETVDSDTRYQYTGTLTVQVGRDPAELTLSVVEREKVTGTINLNGATSGTIRFVGPDNKTLAVTTAFNDLYLQPGDYTVYVDATNGTRHYVYLGAQTITAGSDLSITAELGSLVNGRVQYSGTTQSVSATAYISNGTAVLPVAVSSGTFAVYLKDGAYTVEVEYFSTATIDGVTRYVVNSADQDFTVSGTTTVNIALSRDLEYADVSGSITGAASNIDLTFMPLSTTGEEATATSNGGTYQVSLAPGTYSVYGHDSANNVVFTTIEVKSNQANSVDLTVQAGHVVSGKVTYNSDAAGGAKVTFSSGAKAVVTADSNGDYSAVLPAGIYNVSAVWIFEEVSGVNVTYSQAFDLNLSGAKTQNIALDRKITGAVTITWDGVKDTIDAGETVYYDVVITNRGNIDDTYKLSTSSAWNVSFSQPTVSLGWGTSGTTTATVTVAITAPANAKVDHSAIVIYAASTNHTGANSSVSLDMNINPIYDVDVTMSSPEVYNTTGLTYTFTVKNTGNIKQSYNLSVNADLMALNGWEVKIGGTGNDYLLIENLAAGSSKTVTVTLDPKTSEPSLTTALEIDVAEVNGNATATTSVTAEKSGFDSDQTLTVSGDSVSMSAPQIPGATWFLIALIMVLLVVLVITRVNKGVFGRRRKR